MSLSDLNSNQPHYFFELEKNNYIIKIANTSEELKKAFTLRHKVFSEMSTGFTGDIDIDAYDQSADHLIVVDKSTGDVAGTYRFLLGDKVKSHYSAREFDLTDFLKLPGRKLELGRASVDPSARAGVIITLLWRGIAEYLKITKADYLFGCSSIWDVTEEEITKLTEIFAKKNLISPTKVEPLPSHWPKSFDKQTTADLNSISTFDLSLAEDVIYDLLVPALVKTYIHVGAKFSSLPAYDPKLKTHEFFGYVEVASMNPAFKKKYLSE